MGFVSSNYLALKLAQIYDYKFWEPKSWWQIETYDSKLFEITFSFFLSYLFQFYAFFLLFYGTNWFVKGQLLLFIAILIETPFAVAIWEN